MSIAYTHALNYSQVESNLVDTSMGFISEETFSNHNQQYYSPSTSSEMETMFSNSQHLLVKQEEKEHFSSHYNGYTSYASSSSNQMIYLTQQPNQGFLNDFDASFLASENYYDTETKIDSSKNFSNLIRHKSSPAQFFSNYSLHNDALREVGSFGSFDITNGQTTTSTTGFHGTMNFQFNTPKTPTTSMDKFFHIQGSVPCKIRAKRGFATHPRSIAERERRIRISARIKKLQDLFPNSDKQTSTADMLDVAVDYIKDLRKQLKILSDTKAKCSCTRN